jgi:tRNA-dihydrouridine synthase
LGVLEMRMHYSNYFKGIPNFKETRMQLVTSEEPEELRALLLSVPELV